MEDKITTKLSSDWVRCQSKSRPDKYYMFNKKTGETDWCSSSETSPQKTVLAKHVNKTPAQDRLKRLQSGLQKKKSSELTTGKEKGGRQSAKEEQLQIETPKVSDKKATVSAGSEVKEPMILSSSSTKTSVQDRLKLSPTKSAVPRGTLADEAKINKRQGAASKRACTEETKETVEPKPKQKALEHNFVIPKKPKQRESPGKPVATLASSNAEKRVPDAKHSSPLSVSSASLSDQKLTKENKPLEQLSSSPAETTTTVQCDLNDNEQTKNDVKPGIVSKIKDFCSKLINREAKPKATAQKNLSVSSKPSFKPKKPVRKNSLQNEKDGLSTDVSLLSHRNALSSFKVSSPIPVPNESANARLLRLRRSLQLQQITTPSLKLLSHDSSIDSSLYSTSGTSSECEPMDWQPIFEECTETVSVARSTDSSTISEHYDMVNENLMRLAADKKQTKVWKADHFYFVVDTNVFLENLTFVEELTSMKLCDTLGTVIYVPYCVLQELDKLKIRSPSESIKTRSARAIKYLNQSLTKKQIQAQTAADESQHLVRVTSPDDSILNCCLQVKKQVDNVILLTEDINLRNKAMCNDILVSTKSDLISKHESLI